MTTDSTDETTTTCVDLAHVEKVLCRHAHIQQAVVFVLADGAGTDKRTCAAVVPTPSDQLLDADVAGWVYGLLGKAHMPDVVLILTEMSAIDSSKPDRATLLRLAADHIKNHTSKPVESASR